jgi:thymidylate synthase
VFQYLIAKELNRRGLNVKPGKFTWFYDNIQIYDRHFDQAHIMLDREPIECSPTITIDDDVTWETVMPENVHVNGYPIKEIKEKNPQLTFDLGI